MTELMYLKDSYLKEFEAKVTATASGKVELDRTCFYVQGGGQPSDKGKLYSGEMEFKVNKVAKEQGIAWHCLDRDGLKKGDSVRGEIDWESRHRHMRMHSSAHLLAAVIYRETGTLITGNQLGGERSRMDFATRDYSPGFFRKIEESANREIQKNHEIKISFLPKDDALEDSTLFRLKDDWRKDPKNIGMVKALPNEIRVVSIGDIDRQADGGTHVKTTLEIGKLRIVKTENKGAENRRIYWELEEPQQ